MKAAWLRFLATAVSLVLATAVHAADLKVGVSLSLSGPNASLGIPYAKGMQAALAYKPEVKGRKVQLIVLDDASDPTSAGRNARKLVEQEKVDVLVGSSGVPGTIAMAQVARETATPFIAVTPLRLPPSDQGWAVTVVQPPTVMIDAIVQRMKRNGVKTVGFIGFSDAWGDLVYNALNKAAALDGIRVVANERYARADLSITGQALRVIATKPDAIMTGGSGTPGALPYLELAKHGFKGGVYGQHGLINADFVRVASTSAEGGYFPTGPVIVAEQLPEGHPTKKMGLAFRSAFEKRHGERTTDAYSAYSFDAYVVFADAAARALAGKAQPGTSDFRLALRDAIFATREVAGAHAVYNFQRGELYGVDQRARVIVKLDKGRWTLAP